MNLNCFAILKNRLQALTQFHKTNWKDEICNHLYTKI